MRAFVNKVETKIYRANYFMRAVKIPEGERIVTFRYDSWIYKVGKVLGVLGILSFGLLYVWNRKRP